MKQFFFTVAIFGTFLSAALAAPWVVYDSRNDMLAMSSEVSESAVAFAAPPAAATTLKSIDDEAATAEPESIAEISNDVPAQTTEGQPQLDAAVPEPEPEQSAAESETVQTTVKPMADDAQEDVAEVTTMLPVSSSIGSLLEDDIQREDMHLKIIPDSPVPPTRQNPNSIEEEDQTASVIVVSKKKHEIFSGKKSKFSM